MTEDDKSVPLNNVVKIDDERIRGHLDHVVRGTVEDTLNALLDAEAAPPDVRDCHHRTLQAARNFSRGSLH